MESMNKKAVLVTKRLLPERASPEELLKEVRHSKKLTNYNKKQIVRALKKGLGRALENDWALFNHAEISEQELARRVAKHLMHEVIREDEIYFTSMDDFFDRY